MTDPPIPDGPVTAQLLDLAPKTPCCRWCFACNRSGADSAIKVARGCLKSSLWISSGTSRCSRADLLADLNEAICELEASTSPSAADVAKRLEAHVERIER